jgi:DNA-binding HxlR family transcriptional regulator
MTDSETITKEMPPYNVFDERCPTRNVLARIADKWALLILARLENGPMRFNHLQRDIQRITKKVLTQSLRKRARRSGFARSVCHRAGNGRVQPDAARPDAH